MRKQMKLEGK